MVKKNKLIIIVSICAVVAVAFLAWRYTPGAIEQLGWYKEGEAPLEKAASNLLAAKTVRVNYRQDFIWEPTNTRPAGQEVIIECQAEIEFPDAGEITCQTTTGGVAGEQKTVYILHSRAYVPSLQILSAEEGGAADEWVEQTLNEPEKKVGAYYAHNLLEFLAAGGATLDQQISDTVEGVSVDKYVYNAKVEKFRGLSEIFDSLAAEISGGAVQAIIMIESATHLPKSYEIIADGEGVSAVIRISFSDYGALEKITRPEHVIELPSDTRNSTDIADPEDYQARNVKRKSDLLQLGAILEKYYTDNGYYPETDDSLSRTDDRAGVLYRALVPQYAESLPLDPRPEEYYYGYLSPGGEDYTLSCVSEQADGGTSIFQIEGP